MHQKIDSAPTSSEPSFHLGSSREIANSAPTPLRVFDALHRITELSHATPVGERLLEHAFMSVDAPDAYSPLLQRLGFEPIGTPAESAWIKSRPTRWQIRCFCTSQSGAWHRLFEAAFAYPYSHALWQFKYERPCSGGLAAWKNDNMVGFYGGLPRAISFFGEPSNAVQIADVMVHPSERGVMTKSGLFSQLAATFLEHSVGFNKPHLVGFGFPTREAMALAQKCKLYAPVDTMVMLSWSVIGRRLPHWRYAARSAGDADAGCVDALWGAMKRATSQSVIGVRDWAYIKARYLRHPSAAYTVMVIRQRGTHRPAGVIVLRDRLDDGLELVDVVGDPRNARAWIAVAQRQAWLRGRKRLFTWITRSHAHHLNIMGSQLTELNLLVPANTWSDGPPQEVLLNRWWLMAGDTDFR